MIFLQQLLLIAGLVFTVTGCVALLRFQDLCTRLQIATRCVTLGAVLLLAAVFLKYGFAAAGIKALLCVLFLMITVPASAHAIARAVQAEKEKQLS